MRLPEIAFLLLTCAPLMGGDNPAPSSAESGKPTGQVNAQVLIGAIREGRFTDLEKPESLSEAFAGLPVRAITATEAETVWKQDPSFVEMIKGLTGDHYAIAIEDQQGKKFYQAVSPVTVTDSTRRGLQEVIAKKEKTLSLVNAAKQLAGDDRLRKLAEAAAVAGAVAFVADYPDLAAEISRSGSGEFELVRNQLKTAIEAPRKKDQLNRLHFDLSMSLRSLPPESNDQNRIEAIDKFIVDRKLEPEAKQPIVMRKYLVWIAARQYDKALAALDEALAVAPNSELATRIPGFKESVRKRMAATDEKSREEKKSPDPVPQAPPPTGKP